MVSKLLPLVLIVFLAGSAAAQTSGQPGQSHRVGPPSATVKEGIDHFERALYELTPTGRLADAADEFGKAAAAFERELASNRSSADAHVYLARICSYRKEFRKAAEHYDRLGELEPFNVDAFLFGAQAYLDAKEPALARSRLVDAKTRTTDPLVLARLDEYIARVDAMKQ